MNGVAESEIRARIRIFLEPDQRTLVHGRAIHREEARACGLNVESCGPDSAPELWRSVYALHVRAHSFVTVHASKCIETKDDAYFVPLVPMP